MNVDNIRQRFLSLLPSSIYQTEADKKTLEHWLDKLDSTIGTVYHAAVKAGYDEGRAEAWVRQAPSTCSSSQLTIDQLEELASVKVNNEQLRRNVAALKALLDEHRIPYTLQEANEDGCTCEPTDLEHRKGCPMSPVCESCKPEEVVDAIIKDLNGRKHLGIDTCDQDIQEEIRDTWIQIVGALQLEELAQLKVDNEALRQTVVALKATIEAREGKIP